MTVPSSFRLLLLGLTFAGAMPGIALSQPQPARVAVANVAELDVVPRLTVVGTLMPLRNSVVGSAVEGRVLEMLAREGDFVAEDEPIAQLRTVTIKIELEAARAALDLYERELEELKNGARPEEIAQAQAKQLSAQAVMEYARSRHQRSIRLFEQNRTISQEEFDQSESAMIAAEQAYAEATANLDLVQAGPRKERIQQAEARRNQQSETVKHIEDRLEKFTVRMPFNGFVVAEHTEVGEWIVPGSPVFEVAQLDPIEVTAHVPEASVGHLKAGMKAIVTLGALPGEQFEGEIAAIVPRADARARTFPVKIHVKNPSVDNRPRLMSGMLASVYLPLGKPTPALCVPKDALVLGGVRPVVMVVDKIPPADGGRPPANGGPTPSGTARPVPVEVGVSEGSLVAVRGDLQPGQLVIVEGNERVLPGAPVIIVRTVDSAALREMRALPE